MQSDMIEGVLARHKGAGRGNGGGVTPLFVRFELSTGLGTTEGKKEGQVNNQQFPI